MREFIPLATRFVDLPARFPLRRGGLLQGARIAYETFGTLAPAGDNVVLIMTGLSPDAHAASHVDDPSPGWWEGMIGSGKAIDTDRWYVMCVNSLGSCKGSTGPASINPGKGEPYRLDFPDLSIEDIADAAVQAVRALGIDRLACVVGASMGGMSALSLVSRHPGLARSHINISGAVHSQPFSIAIRSLQREAIQFDPNWNFGHYDDACYPGGGMAMARKLGFIAYRSAQEWNHRFGRLSLDARQVRDSASRPFGTDFAVEGYLECHARRFIQSFDPNSYLYLSRSIDWFDLGDSIGASADEVLSRLQLDKALVIGVDTDILFPLHQQRQIAQGLERGGVPVRFVPIESPAGHDAFLVDTGRFASPVAQFMSALS